MRKEEEAKEQEQRQITIDALKQGKSPYFASKCNILINCRILAPLTVIDHSNFILCFPAVRKEQDLREKFDSLKKQGRLDQYMAKKRKHNTQRDRRHMPFSEEM